MTVREALLGYLREGQRTAHEPSGLVGIPEKQVADRLAHIAHSLRRKAERLRARVEVGRCRRNLDVEVAAVPGSGPSPAHVATIQSCGPRSRHKPRQVAVGHVDPPLSIHGKTLRRPEALPVVHDQPARGQALGRRAGPRGIAGAWHPIGSQFNRT
jgi:hypothetical protein